MVKLSVSVVVPADQELVWNDVANLESHADWMADAASIEFVGDDREGVGTTMRVLTRLGPLRTTDVIRVVSWEPPGRIAVIHEGLVTGTGEFRLEAVDAGTRFTWAEHLVFPWYLGGGAVAFLARPVLGLVWRRNLERFAARFR
jgi:carbon monoxide dehydrogenase subunit G